MQLSPNSPNFTSLNNQRSFFAELTSAPLIDDENHYYVKVISTYCENSGSNVKYGVANYVTVRVYILDDTVESFEVMSKIELWLYVCMEICYLKCLIMQWIA